MLIFSDFATGGAIFFLLREEAMIKQLFIATVDDWFSLQWSTVKILHQSKFHSKKGNPNIKTQNNQLKRLCKHDAAHQI